MPSTTPATPEERSLPPPKGPHPSYIETAKPYIFEHQIQAMLRATGISEAAEVSGRVHGVVWIDNVRRSLLLPVRTYDTACIYYHKFRLTHRDDQYDYRTAAAAALFCACKIEDTMKKSREILAAAYNLNRAPSEHLTSDNSVSIFLPVPADIDPLSDEPGPASNEALAQFFDETTKTIHILERLMLEASGFDFRNRYPQKLLVKLAKHYFKLDKGLAITAFDASLDLYKTYAPLKQSTATMALACLELAARLRNDAAAVATITAADTDKWSTSRAELVETLLDLLEIYTHSGKATLLGVAHTLDPFIPITIALREEARVDDLPRFTMAPVEAAPLTSPTTPGDRAGALVTPQSISPQSPAPGARASERGRDGTVRFMLDPERAIEEKKVVRDFFTPHEVTEYV